MALVKYGEGDWFAVPLLDGGFAIGLVARSNPKGVLLGYFFGPKRMSVPTLNETKSLKAEDAVLVGRVGYLGILHGKWPLLGHLDDWDRSEWPIPIFARYEQLTGRSFHTYYDDDDPNRLLREVQVPPGDAELAPNDGLMGAGFAEGVLTRLLD
jgi:hypothetical protein